MCSSKHEQLQRIAREAISPAGELRATVREELDTLGALPIGPFEGAEGYPLDYDGPEDPPYTATEIVAQDLFTDDYTHGHDPVFNKTDTEDACWIPAPS